MSYLCRCATNAEETKPLTLSSLSAGVRDENWLNEQFSQVSPKIATRKQKGLLSVSERMRFVKAVTTALVE